MRNTLLMFFAAVVMVACSPQTAQKTNETVNLEEMTPEQKASYSYGILVADNLKRGKIEGLDAALVAKGLEDMMNGEETLLSMAEATSEWQAFAQAAQQKQEAVDQASSAGNIEAGKKFLAENKKKEGVVELPSGLQYKILKAGNGPKPGLNDKVKTHYHGTLLDGTVFDSSVERGEPISFPVTGVIKGWTEALQLMPVGSKWELFIPSELAYGARRAGEKIAPNSTLIFEVELLEIE